MNLSEALTIVGGIWAIYIVLYGTAFGPAFRIYGNIMRTWTGARYVVNRVLTLRGTKYVRFSLREQADVPRAMKIVRYHRVGYCITLGAAVLLFLIFLGLGVYTAFVCWNVVGTSSNEIPKEQAAIVVTAHVLAFFCAFGLSPFYQYFKDRYLNTYYEINDSGELEPYEAP